MRWRISLAPVPDGRRPYTVMVQSLRRQMPGLFGLPEAKAIVDLAYSGECYCDGDDFAIEVATALEAGGGKVSLEVAP